MARRSASRCLSPSTSTRSRSPERRTPVNHDEVCARAVRADDLHAGMSGQPVRERLGVTAFQQLERRAGLAVDQQRAVVPAAPNREVVHPDYQFPPSELRLVQSYSRNFSGSQTGSQRPQIRSNTRQRHANIGAAQAHARPLPPSSSYGRVVTGGQGVAGSNPAVPTQVRRLIRNSDRSSGTALGTRIALTSLSALFDDRSSGSQTSAV